MGRIFIGKLEKLREKAGGKQQPTVFVNSLDDVVEKKEVVKTDN